MLFLLCPMAADRAALPAVGVASCDMLRPACPAPPPTSFRSRAFRSKLLVLGRRFSAAVCWTGATAAAAATGPAAGSDLIISDVDDLRRLGLVAMDRYGEGGGWAPPVLFGDEDWVVEGKSDACDCLELLPSVAVLRRDSW